MILQVYRFLNMFKEVPLCGVHGSDTTPGLKNLAVVTAALENLAGLADSGDSAPKGKGAPNTPHLEACRGKKEGALMDCLHKDRMHNFRSDLEAERFKLDSTYKTVRTVIQNS
jgi:hypothetical protein